MSRITMIQARPMPQQLHTLLHPNLPQPHLQNRVYTRGLLHSHHPPVVFYPKPTLLSEADHECHHEREQPSSFSEGETQNGIIE